MALSEERRKKLEQAFARGEQKEQLEQDQKRAVETAVQYIKKLAQKQASESDHEES